MYTSETRCEYCLEKITSTFIWYNNKPYHDHCFNKKMELLKGGTIVLPNYMTHSPSFSAWGENPTVEDLFKVMDINIKPKRDTWDDTRTYSISITGYDPQNPYFGNQPYPQDKNFEIKRVQKRDSWDVYFMKLADLVSTRSTCDRKHCGSVLVKDNRIISCGYNGSNPGWTHCDDVGHFMVNGSCKRTIHAEINVIKDAKMRLNSLEGCILYTNTYPCISCFWAIMKEGIKQIYYKDTHSSYIHDEDMEKVAKTFDIKIEKVVLDG